MHKTHTTNWSDLGSIIAPDTKIMEWARNNGYLVLTHDLDYGAILFATKARSPSVIQLRSEDVRPKSVGKILVQALDRTEKEIEQGVLITVDPRKSRIHLLPLKKKNS